MPPIPPMPPQPAFVPTNALEEALMRAANEPEFRPIFYQQLLSHELIILPLPAEGRDTGEITIEPGSEIQLQMLNDNKLPIFSSVERVFEGGIVPEGMPYLRMRGFDFFNMVRGAECVLNPFSPVGKLLTAQELEELLSGNLIEDTSQEAAPEARVQLGQPADYPTALADSVREFSQAQPLVKAVYLAQLQVEGSPEPPRLLLGFDIEGEDPAFLQDMGPFVQPHLREGELIDMMVISTAADDPLAAYFRQTEPVYQKA
ncbi:enhanced serine sensitivity protein SseB C-terminal domain-containing protein [Hymenobacter sp. J193]|uniref:enhanced serine sensitivity protein SseB C-terminal domain-containing protein n=1 Tax=Hymenobacter sp. J193 TaxID=2898429 RepID=UPI002150C6D0|nr:enhanced serine sensitivity protein SseB C-terminal domain-containing protein [Hymenobacter sp. J193]MCR5889798.1 enhanced serine sensitivity protein SseB C-terminal domain-containing protein [Hymenobacter sp. J193]